MSIDEFINDDRKYVAGTYGRQPIAFVKGQGSRLIDSEGKEYIDFFAGLAVNNTGHCHPRVVEAIKNQSERLMHTSNVFYILPQIELARLLFEVSRGFQSFFCNSGAEANEAAIKLIRKHTGKTEIIAAKNSFHGRTFGSLSATGQEKYKTDFQPLSPNFKHVEYGSIDALKSAVDDETAAILLEPIQGEGGVIVPDSSYLRDVRKLCDEKDILMVLDEVQTGFGRTGKMFAWQHFEIMPDIFTVAKALGGGFPIGAMLARPKIMDSFKPGDHASTFGGTHLACAAAKAALVVIMEEQLAERSEKMGGYLEERLLELKEKHSIVKDVRGMGLMIGMELDVECSGIISSLLEEGIILNCVHDNVLRFLPPLVISKEEIDFMLNKLDPVLREASENYGEM